MRYTVVWTPAAIVQLAGAWLRASDRNAVTTSQHQIDQLLRVDPQTRGFPLFGGRVLAVPPLHARFTINDPDMTVEVVEVW